MKCSFVILIFFSFLFTINVSAKSNEENNLQKICELLSDNCETGIQTKALLKVIRITKEDINKTDSLGNTALIYAAKTGDLELVRALLKRGAAVDHLKLLYKNNPNPFGYTALIGAVESGNLDVVRELVEKGANVNQKDEMENSAIAYARRDKKNVIVQYLLKKGANSRDTFKADR